MKERADIRNKWLGKQIKQIVNINKFIHQDLNITTEYSQRKNIKIEPKLEEEFELENMAIEFETHYDKFKKLINKDEGVVRSEQKPKRLKMDKNKRAFVGVDRLSDLRDPPAFKEY
eukprot:CAMPEP_0114575546 /NCGR_PEP_ID=MMETSP0125-20121206/400_1 /TAXON_ID=485358 ORGANISM="Aristerostoma sp., Strain ATCC 50986" /NCGR_SAMPLE_ID=MMETSP0125 /ASSEMBLY_ACC=CAM_ASM_000245 /LENGTH=115 /DNA_ID=CAMNT_0001763353 /DNA_START=433 /DNA_END=780 /DNA_ORIENTATION=+